jgi:bifunctional DNase/RNase
MTVLCLLSAACFAAAGVAAPLPAPSPAPTAAVSPVPVHISGLRMLGPEQVLLLLADDAEERAVPISVGRDQGIAIYLGRVKADTPRPMTHDLMANIVSALGAVVQRITVTDLKDDVYFAEIRLKSGGRTLAIDARPSDAIALAVRTGAPMFASPGLLKSLAEPGAPGGDLHADRRLGLTVQELDPALAESIGARGVTGVLVASVARGGPAEQAGVRRGDVLLALDGHAVATLAAYRAAAADAVSAVTVWRDGRESTLRTP